MLVHHLASALQPNSPRAPPLQALLPSPVISSRPTRSVPEPSRSSPHHTASAALALLSSEVPPVASLPESSDSLPADFMQQPEPPESPLRHFLPRATKAQSPSSLSKASRRLGSLLDASTLEVRAVREDSAQQVRTLGPMLCCHQLCTYLVQPQTPSPPTPTPHPWFHDLTLAKQTWRGNATSQGHAYSICKSLSCRYAIHCHKGGFGMNDLHRSTVNKSI